MFAQGVSTQVGVSPQGVVSAQRSGCLPREVGCLLRDMLVFLNFCKIVVSARLCGSLCLIVFSCFIIETDYSNFTFRGA